MAVGKGVGGTRVAVGGRRVAVGAGGAVAGAGSGVAKLGAAVVIGALGASVGALSVGTVVLFGNGVTDGAGLATPPGAILGCTVVAMGASVAVGKVVMIMGLWVRLPRPAPVSMPLLLRLILANSKMPPPNINATAAPPMANRVVGTARFGLGVMARWLLRAATNSPTV